MLGAEARPTSLRAKRSPKEEGDIPVVQLRCPETLFWGVPPDPPTAPLASLARRTAACRLPHAVTYRSPFPLSSYAPAMVGERAEQLVRAPLGRALLAEIIGYDVFVVDAGIELAARAAEALPRLDSLASCTEPLALLAALQNNPLGFGFSANHAEWDELLSAGADALLPVAEALVSSPATSTWWDTLDVERQRWATCTHGESAMPREDALAAAVTDTLEKDRARQTDPQAIAFYRRSLKRDNCSGEWWSTPIGSGAVFTSPSGPGDLPCLELATMEDSPGVETFDIWSIEMRDSPRVFEVQQPDDWGRLVDIAPMDVTVTPRHGLVPLERLPRSLVPPRLGHRRGTVRRGSYPPRWLSDDERQGCRGGRGIHVLGGMGRRNNPVAPGCVRRCDSTWLVDRPT